MTAPLECPIPLGQACTQMEKITTLTLNMAMIMELLKELRDDMKGLKVTVGAIAKLEQENVYSREAMARAFDRIGILERAKEDHEGALQQFKGARSTVVALWAILGSAFGLITGIIIKHIFFP